MTLRQLLEDAFICPLCGMPKIHYRLHGYRCTNPEHDEKVKHMSEKELAEARAKWQGKANE